MSGRGWRKPTGAAQAALACLALGALQAAGAQALLEPFTAQAERVVITERSDFSRYEDGRYLGHVYREARVGLSAEAAGGGRVSYSGEAMVFEETLRDLRAVARAIEADE